MKCKCELGYEIPDDSLNCMYCGRHIQTQQEIDERNRKKAEAERLEAERLEAERLKAERLEAERLEAERLKAEKQKEEQQKKERLERIKEEKKGQKEKQKGEKGGRKDGKKTGIILLALAAAGCIWIGSSVLKGALEDTESGGQPGETEVTQEVEPPAPETEDKSISEDDVVEDVSREEATETSDAQPADNGSGSASTAFGTVAGKVVDKESNAAIEGARIIFTNEDGMMFPQDEVIKSDSNGSFTASIPGGTYSVKVTKADYLDYVYSEKVEVKSGETSILRGMGIEKDPSAKKEVQDTKDASAESDEYIIPYSNTRYLTDADLDSLSEWDLKLARNEIYARHGRRFKDPELQRYFDSRSWYNGIYDPEDFDKNHASELSKLEKQNAEYILAYEKKHGYFT